MDNKEQFRKMPQERLRFLRLEAKQIPLSPFAKFCQKTKGYFFYTKKKKKIDKWEVFKNQSEKGIENLLNNQTKITAIKNREGGLI